LELIIARAQEKFQEAGGKKDELKIFRVGQEGAINGIPVSLRGLGGDGSLIVDAATHEGHRALFDIKQQNPDLTGYPSELFIPTEAK
jgi:hypothetical protein